MQKIFINNVPVYLKAKTLGNTGNTQKNVLHINYRSLEELKDSIKYIEKSSNELTEVHILANSLNKVQKDFLSLYKLIEAAGGLVINDFNEALLIYRFNKWDLPKGKIEKGEQIAEAALREVQEETGVKELAITGKIDLPTNTSNVTYHTYLSNTKKDKRILKRTYWFSMKTPGRPETSPQLAEGITNVKFVPVNAITEESVYLNNTYLSIREVLLNTIV